jgi:hypothetical protein
MELASAYPNSALSAGAMAAIVVVMAGGLIVWLVLVFLADRKTSELSARRAQPTVPAPVPATTVATAGADVTGPDDTTEDEASEAGHGDDASRRRAAA